MFVYIYIYTYRERCIYIYIYVLCSEVILSRGALARGRLLGKCQRKSTLISEVLISGVLYVAPKCMLHYVNNAMCCNYAPKYVAIYAK